jgi:hypothetical protein
MGMSMPSYANALFGTEDGGSSWKALTLTQNPIQDIDLADSCFVALDSKSQIITIQ